MKIAEHSCLWTGVEVLGEDLATAVLLEEFSDILVDNSIGQWSFSLLSIRNKVLIGDDLGSARWGRPGRGWRAEH